jgi:putative DNA-invertase from lambdoid prophage Rac
MAAMAQAQAEGTKAAQRAERTKQHEDRAHLGRKPSFTRQQLDNVRDMLGQQAVRIARVAKATGLSHVAHP